MLLSNVSLLLRLFLDLRWVIDATCGSGFRRCMVSYVTVTYGQSFAWSASNGGAGAIGV